MQRNESFPLESFPTRVRDAILDEFKGRRPTILEVASIPDAYWLATPAIGPRTLAKIRSYTRKQQSNGEPAVVTKSDVELIARRDVLQAELKRIEDELKAIGTELWMRGIYPQPRRD